MSDFICTTASANTFDFSIEKLKEVMKKFPKRIREVFKFDGTLAQLLDELNKAGVEIRHDSFCRATYDTLTGVHLVEVPEYNCVLIGDYSAIIAILDDKENQLGNVSIFEGFTQWYDCGRHGDRSSSKNTNQ